LNDPNSLFPLQIANLWLKVTPFPALTPHLQSLYTIIDTNNHTVNHLAISCSFNFQWKPPVALILARLSLLSKNSGDQRSQTHILNTINKTFKNPPKMRTSTVLSVLFAATALAVPVNNKRVVVEDVVVVTVTDFVYPDGSPATPAAAPVVDSPHSLYIAPKPSTTEQPAVPAAPSPSPVEAPKEAPVQTTAPAAAPAAAAVETTSAPAPSPVYQAPASGAPTTLVPNLDVSSPTYTAIALAHHNAHRSNHSAPAVEYNATVAAWAQKKAESCVWNEDM